MNQIQGMFSNLTTITDARTCRVSSWDHSGRNQDYWVIPSGETITLGDIKGPGCITHIWLTSSCRRVSAPGLIDPVLNGQTAPVNEIAPPLGIIWDKYDPFYYRKVLIRMTWNDQEGPSVLAPLGDFFCVGHSYPGNFSSLPFNVSLKPEEAGKFGAPCSMSCYLPMPFAKKAKIEIINENDLPILLYFHIDYELYTQELPENTAYFHASWRREHPCDGWGPDLQVNSPEVNAVSNLSGEGNYVVLEAEGCGHFIGCNLSVHDLNGSWWGEGDDMIQIDGEEFPSISGTGIEDYFNHAWGMQKNAFPFYGTIIHKADTGGYQTCYRFHITDPIRFKKKIRVSMEHGHANHLSDDWSSTAYWYQQLPSKPVSIQPVEERIPFVPRLPHIERTTPPLNEEMLWAQMHTKERWGPYYDARNRVMWEKEQKTREEAQENIYLAEEVRRNYHGE